MNQIPAQIPVTQIPIAQISTQQSVSSQAPIIIVPPPPPKKWRAFFKAKKQIVIQPSVQKSQLLQQTAVQGTKQKTLQNKKQTQKDKQQASNKDSPCEHQENNKIKNQLQQTSQDSRSQLVKKIVQAYQKTESQIQQISKQTKKILAIFDQKQSLVKPQTHPKIQSIIKLQKSLKSQLNQLQKITQLPQKQNKPANQKNQLQLSTQKVNQFEQGEKNNTKKCKHAGKHFKIFNPEHFQVDQQQQHKTSIHRWFYGSGQTPSQLLISSWNVNGIRARIANNDILPYLQSTKIDIFCINEHKIDQKSFDQSQIKFWGYHSYWNFPKYSLGYSGVAIFSKYPAKQMIQDLHIPQHSKQGRVITLQFDKFLLIHAYIPTVGRQLERLRYRVQQFDPAFKEYILKLKEKFAGKTIIICGDLNVAHKDLDCHVGKRMKLGKQPAYTFQQRNSFTIFLKEAEMVDTFRHFSPSSRQYTWWNMRRGGRQRGGQTGIGKRLDYFLVDKQSMKYVKSSQIKKKVKGCDHCPIQLRVNFQ